MQGTQSITSAEQGREAGRLIRVLLIAPSLDILGGQSVQATRLLACLGERKDLRMSFQPINPRLPRPFRSLQSIKYLRTLLTFVSYFTLVMVRAPRHHILHVFSASYYSYMLWTMPAMFFARLYGKKLILNYRDGQAEDHLRNWRTAIPTVKLADAIVTPSGFLVDVFDKFGLEARPIFNIIDMSRFQYRKRRRLQPLFLHNRILEPLYDVETTLRAFSIIQQRYPEARLTIAHDGICRPGLERYARKLNLRNTQFIGRVPHSEIADLYNSVDIYLTSPVFDCMPGSILECFASGLPVVATNAGGIPYIATHEETALLVSCRDYEALAASALRLLADEELVERLTSQAYEACKRYAAGPVRDQWTALYHELLARPARRGANRHDG